MVFGLHFWNTAQLLKKSCTAFTQHYTAVNYSIYTAVSNEVKTGHICVILIKFVSKTSFSVFLVWKPAFSFQVLSIFAHQNCIQKKNCGTFFFRCELFSLKVEKHQKSSYIWKKVHRNLCFRQKCSKIQHFYTAVF